MLPLLLLIILSFVVLKWSQHSWLQNTSLTSLSLWITLFVLELGIRWVNPHDLKFWGIGYPPGLHIADSQLRFKYQPNFQGYFQSPRYAHIPVNINSFGFRDEELDSQAQKRILVLGDSVTFGAGVEAEKRYTDLLESTLNDQSMTRHQVLAMAVNSYQLDQEVTMYEQMTSTPHDVVLLAFVLNDINHGLEDTIDPATQLKAKTGLAAWWQHFDNRYRPSELYLARFLMVRLSIANQRPDLTSDRLLTQWQSPGHLTRMESYIQHLKSLTEQHQKTLLVTILPHQHLLLSEQLLPQQQLQEVLTKYQIPFLDFAPIFAQHTNPESLYLYKDHYHFSESGHQLAAQVLSEWEPLTLRRNSQVAQP